MHRASSTPAFTLRLSVTLLCLAGLFSLPPELHAAESSVTANQSDIRSFDVAPGPLGEVLARYAASAGIALSFDAASLRQLPSPGLKGRYTVQHGFDRLLEGTGLEAVARSPGNYGLQPRPRPISSTTDASPTLAAVHVTAPGLGSTTEDTRSYTTGTMSTATRLNLSPRETPQSISVLTRGQIEDLGLTTLDDAVHNVTGLVMQKGYYVGDSGSFSARGFPIANLLLDGLPTSTGANGTFNSDNDSLDIYDRIEVVRGATGLTTGAGTPSAAINLMRKRPTAENQASVSVSVGNWSNFRTVVDAGGPLNAAGTLRGRAVATLQDTRQYYAGAHDRAHQLYAILEADLTPATVASLGFHYRKVDDQGGSPSLPSREDGSFYPGLSRATNLSNGFEEWRQTDQSLFADLTHKFANGWQAKAAALWKRPEQDMTFSGLSRIGGTLYQNTQSYRLDNRQDSYDVSLNGPFTLLGRSHELMFGASHREYDNRNCGGWAGYSWTTSGPVVDPYNWNASRVPRPGIDMTQWGIDNTTRQQALYAATRLSLATSLKLILGSRVNWYESTNHRASTRYAVDGEVTPYAGVVYALDDKHSLYASWTEIFEPQGSNDRNGRLLKPITGTNREVGIKGAYFDGRLNASLATFEIKQQNRAVSDLDGPNPCPGSAWGYCQRASGEIESKGFELELAGALTPNWQIMTGYTFVSAKYTKDSDTSRIGQLFDGDLPRRQFKLATSYRLPGSLSRWRVGGQVYAQNRTFASDAPSIEQGGYIIAGLNAAYNLDNRTEIRLNINNLFDKRYYQNLGWTTGGNVFGTPRNLLLSAKYHF